MPPGTSRQRVDKLLAKLEPELQRAFEQMVAKAKAGADLEALAAALSRGDIESALLGFELAAAEAGDAVVDAFIAGGRAGADDIRTALRGRVGVSFNVTNVAAVEQMKVARLSFIRENTKAAKETARLVLQDGIARGLNPIEQARGFRDSIGLTKYQEQTVINYRDNLIDPQTARGQSALTRKLRDRRSDGVVKRHLSGEKRLTKAQIDGLTKRYRGRLVKHNAKSIARTEALSAVQTGFDSAYKQAFQAGTLRPEQLQETWFTTRDGRERDSHAAMDGQVRPGPGQPFISGNGNPLMYPGDPSAPFEDTAQCRCSIIRRIIA